MNPLRQRNFLVRMERYVVGVDDFWRQAQSDGIGLSREVYLARLHNLAVNERLVALAATMLHLTDEYEYGLLSAEAVIEAGSKMIGAYTSGAVDEAAGGDPVDRLTRLFIKTVNWVIRTSNSGS